MPEPRKPKQSRSRQSMYDQTVSVGGRKSRPGRSRPNGADRPRRDETESVDDLTATETEFYDTTDASVSMLDDSLSEVVGRKQNKDAGRRRGVEDADPGFGPGRVSGRDEPRRIGEILVRMGVLTASQVDGILKAQASRKKSERFGRIARKLGLADRADVKQALSIQKPSRSRSSGIRASRDGIGSFKGSVSRELCCLSDKPNSTAEAIRSLRSQLLIRSKGNGRGSAVAVMSPEKKDGRSFIAANLAVAYAQAGRRTLLVDADLRSPRQHTIFNTENTAGFSSLLEGTSNDHPVYTTLDNLYLVPAGPGRTNPQDLLCRDEAGQWMDVARDYFDVIVLDTPAANSFSDAEIISTWATQSIVVVRKNVTRSGSIDRLRERMSSSGLPITGFVVNE